MSKTYNLNCTEMKKEQSAAQVFGSKGEEQHPPAQTDQLIIAKLSLRRSGILLGGQNSKARATKFADRQRFEHALLLP